jgi:hypothetical protein
MFWMCGLCPSESTSVAGASFSRVGIMRPLALALLLMAVAVASVSGQEKAEPLPIPLDKWGFEYAVKTWGLASPWTPSRARITPMPSVFHMHPKRPRPKLSGRLLSESRGRDQAVRRARQPPIAIPVPFLRQRPRRMPTSRDSQAITGCQWPLDEDFGKLLSSLGIRNGDRWPMTCSAWVKAEVRDCAIPSCPLYPHRPYQRLRAKTPTTRPRRPERLPTRLRGWRVFSVVEACEGALRASRAARGPA